jgi:ribose-phosphate pyrophosphokinase
MPNGKKLVLCTGSANRPLAERIAAYIGQPLCDVEVGRHPDDEIFVRFHEDIRGAHVVIIQPTNQPETNLSEVRHLAHTARLASAGSISLVAPYFGYARQDRKTRPRENVAAKQVAVEIGNAGVQHVILLDLHAAQVQNYFDEKLCVADHIFARPVFIGLIRHLGLHNFVLGPPDVGRAKVVESYWKRLGGSMFFAVKRKDEDRVDEVVIVGDVAEKTVLVFDDESSTGGTLALATQALANAGAGSIEVFITHGKLVSNAVRRIAESSISRLFVGDSVLVPEEAFTALGERIVQVTFAPLLGEAIKRLHADQSVSQLFNDEYVSGIYNGRYFV